MRSRNKTRETSPYVALDLDVLAIVTALVAEDAVLSLFSDVMLKNAHSFWGM